MPELMIQQNIQQLLDLKLQAQVFCPNGKALDAGLASSFKIRRIRQLGSGT